MAGRQKRITSFFTSPTRSLSTDRDRNDDQTPSVAQGDDSHSTRSDCDTHCDPPESKKKKTTERKFQESWRNNEKCSNWFEYNSEKKHMHCKICRETGKQNTFTEQSGCENFRTSTLDRHMRGSDHLQAIEEVALRRSFDTAVNRALSENDQGIISAMQSVYWLAKEDIATRKYESLLKFLKLQGVQTVDKLRIGQNASYTSRQTAEEMQDAIGKVIANDIQKQLQESEFVSVLSDESTDISVSKKLVMYVRVIEEDFTPKTRYIGNVKVKDGTAETIATELKINLLEKHRVKPSQLIGFGSDGASVMRGRKNGVSVRIQREVNPYLISIHCVAHRLALCTSQAADGIPYLKKYRQTLTDIYYYFKRSAVRTEGVKEIQAILDDPSLKYKEVHDVRWFSFYAALETIYRTYGSLVTYFRSVAEKTPVAKGLNDDTVRICCYDTPTHGCYPDSNTPEYGISVR
ncbi:uncharacterized protein C17orf113-like [Ptychodera flava]|uniref:uncharacterized protein C17orf113-like n=1 Tax=Ptychodera flava TaxID=63121 RepID=UPI00396A1B00